MMRRVEKLTNSHGALVDYKNELLDRLRANDCVLPFSGAGEWGDTIPQKHAFWLPLSYHPWWHRQIKRAVSRVNDDGTLNVLLSSSNRRWRENSRVGIAWKNILPTTSSLIQQ